MKLILSVFSSFHTFRCCCGQERALHPIVPGTEIGSPNDKWVPNKHTRPHPTDAYGTIEFQGGAHPTKAQVRVKSMAVNFSFLIDKDIV
jgi:hypothetical protein